MSHFFEASVGVGMEKRPESRKLDRHEHFPLDELPCVG